MYKVNYFVFNPNNSFRTSGTFEAINEESNVLELQQAIGEDLSGCTAFIQQEGNNPLLLRVPMKPASPEEELYNLSNYIHKTKNGDNDVRVVPKKYAENLYKWYTRRIQEGKGFKNPVDVVEKSNLYQELKRRHQQGE